MMNYSDWVETVPVEFRRDALWRVEAYRLALFIGELGWHDVSKLMRDRRTFHVSDQLYRALGSISANIAEGYSRGSSRDRARFYEYALGSSRESRDWYYKARHVLGDAVFKHRIDLLTQIIRLLLTMIPEQRQQTVREEPVDYTTNKILVTDAPLPEINVDGEGVPPDPCDC